MVAAPHILLHRASAHTQQGRSPLQQQAEAFAWWGSSQWLSLKTESLLLKALVSMNLHRLCADHGVFHCPAIGFIKDCLELLGYVFTYIKILTRREVRHLLSMIIPFLYQKREHILQSYKLKLLTFSISFKWRVVS